MSVFSNYLNPFIDEGLLPNVDQSNAADVYELLRIAYNQGASGVIHTTKFFVPHLEESYKRDELLYEAWRNKDLQEVIAWFNSKLIPEFITLDYRAKFVRARIAVSKMRKLVEQGKLRKDYFILYCENLTKTLWNEQYEIVDTDLPF